MREMKFKAWDKENKRFVKPEHLLNPKVMSIDLTDEGFKFKNASFIYLQYTGLKDKNGKEIYEGDIIKIWNPAYKNYANVKIEWGEYSYKLRFIPSVNCPLIDISSLYTFGDGEVIGNIYENPDLLEDSNALHNIYKNAPKFQS